MNATMIPTVQPITAEVSRPNHYLVRLAELKSRPIYQLDYLELQELAACQFAVNEWLDAKIEAEDRERARRHNDLVDDLRTEARAYPGRTSFHD